jgi:threonine dehydrogenase-like Zn-dependent dehydrogenase
MGTAARIRAVVQVGPKRLELREFEHPIIDPDEGLLRVEACGICGTDVELYTGHAKLASYPFIPGHEPAGVIDEVGERAAQRWGVKVGDRVAVEPLLTCGSCKQCLSGLRTLCSKQMSYGFTSTSASPGLWGAYADYMYLHPGTFLHEISARIPPQIAVMFNPLGAGFRWAVHEPSLLPGDTIVILGAGQRGLAAVIAARSAGAGMIIVTDLAKAKNKLALASEFGAHHTIVADEETAVDRVAQITGGRLADVVLDVNGAAQPVIDAIDMVRPGGTIVLAGVKGTDVATSLVTDKLVFQSITMRGVFTVDTKSYKQAIELIESGAIPLEKLRSEKFALEDAEAAIGRLAGTDGLAPAIHVVIQPELRAGGH